MRRSVIRALTPLIAACVLVSVQAQASDLNAHEVIARNIAARGGADAMRNLQSMVWVGHIRSANAPVADLAFIMEMKRPGNKRSGVKTRFEIKAQSVASLHVYDGSHGWKWHLNSSGRPEIQPYTAEELRFEHDGPGPEMPFADLDALTAAQDGSVTQEGIEDVEGRKAYRIGVRMPSGETRHVWIDAASFLIVKSDRESRNALGQAGTVSVLYRDYRTVGGLQLPFTIESGAGSGKVTDKMVIDRIVLNPPLDDAQFAKPGLPQRGFPGAGRSAVTVRAERGR